MVPTGHHRATIGTQKGDRIDYNQTKPSKEEDIYDLLFNVGDVHPPGGWVTIGGFWKLEVIVW